MLNDTADDAPAVLRPQGYRADFLSVYPAGQQFRFIMVAVANQERADWWCKAGLTSREYARESARDYGLESARDYGRDPERIHSYDTDYGRTTSRFYGRSGYEFGREDYDPRAAGRPEYGDYGRRRDVRGRTRGTELLGNLATYAFFPLLGGLILAYSDEGSLLPDGAYALAVFAVFVGANVLNFTMIATHTVLLRGGMREEQHEARGQNRGRKLAPAHGDHPAKRIRGL